MTITIESRIRGGLYGVACGDALGATLEFMCAENIQLKYGQLRDIIGGGWLNLKPGQWTDDTDMTLAVARGILDNVTEPVAAVGKHFITWIKTDPPDVGNTIRGAIRNFMADMGRGPLEQARKWHEAAEALDLSMGGHTAGNGALMRTLPVALVYKDLTDIFETSVEIARMTHYDRRAPMTCAFYGLLVQQFLSGKQVIGEALAQARHWLGEKSEYYFAPANCGAILHEIDRSLMAAFTLKHRPKPTGYTVDSWGCAAWALAHNSTLEETIVSAANLGGDADTIGAIAGGLAGVYYGYEAIPERWIETFPKKKRAELDEVAERIMERRATL